MSSKRDIWEVWDDTGQLESVKAFIKDCSRKLITQAEMCKYLNIDTATFSRLKKKHPEIAEIQENAKLDLKKDLMDALYKKAIGYEIVEEDQYIEDRGAGKEQKRKIHRIKKQVGPDYKAIVYLLTKHFGHEYIERYDEFLVVSKLKQAQEEDWNKEQSEEEEDE